MCGVCPHGLQIKVGKEIMKQKKKTTKLDLLMYSLTYHVIMLLHFTQVQHSLPNCTEHYICVLSNILSCSSFQFLLVATPSPYFVLFYKEQNKLIDNSSNSSGPLCFAEFVKNNMLMKKTSHFLYYQHYLTPRQFHCDTMGTQLKDLISNSYYATNIL